MSERVTIADVARAASVSSMTVSRVINDKGDVSPDTRQRVWEVIERLGYRPSGIARGLATRRTGTLGLVVPDVANPFFAGVARGVEHGAYAEGYNVFLCNTEEDPQRELAVLRSLEEKRVDGLLLCSSRLDDAELQAVVTRHAAVVLVNRRLAGDGVHSVLIDDESGGRLATQHLLQAGRHAVGFLAGPTVSHSGRERAAGYRAALDLMRIPSDPGWLRNCFPTVEGGHEAAHELLAAHPELTALFCYNDLVAVGALQACAELSRQVPGDVAVVGYDDIPLAALVTPPLTTCHVPRFELGAQAVRLLLNQIEGCPDNCDEIVLRPELVVRASTP
jgi:LacI family transcriptional regulator, galactose operon repressor